MRIKTLEQNTAQDFAGLQIDQLSKLRNGNITFEQVKWFNNLTFEQREALMGKQPEKTLILKLLSGSEVLKLDACDGQQTIANSKNIFGWIDDDFKSWGTNEKGSATEEAAIDVYEMEKDATFAQMFGSLATDVSTLCLSQNQILNFVEKHRNRLRTDGYGTFFLFKSNNEIFVAGVDFGDGGSLGVGVHRFERAHVWDASHAHRLVVPQLTA